MQIQPASLNKGDIVWYRYSNIGGTQGPYTVAKVGRDHNGEYVLLSQRKGPPFVVYTDDDDYYGMVLFYDSDPSV